MILDLLTLNFKCHGLGFVKAEIPNTEFRLHVWDRKFKHGGRESEETHCHRWAMISKVLQGQMVNQVWHIVERPEGLYRFWVPGNSDHGGETMAPLDRYADCWSEDRTYFKGESYVMQRGLFHRSFADNGTVTLVHRSNFAGMSMSLIPRNNASPLHGAAHKVNNEEILSILSKHIPTMKVDTDVC